MVKKFLRRGWNRFSKLGKGRKKKQVWRNPNGRDNKMREKRRGYPAVISVGYKRDKNLRGTLNDKKPIMINQLVDLEKLAKDEIAVIGKVGKKRKIEIAKVAKEKKIEIYNMNAEKFLKMNEKKIKELKEKVEEKIEKKEDSKEKVTPQAYPDKSSKKISTKGEEEKK